MTIILLGSTAFPQSDSERLGMSANELARKVVTNELKVQNEDLGHWMYRLEKKDAEKKQVQEIVETKDGSLSRLLSTDGRPLDAKQQQKESRRIQRLVSNPGEQRKLQQASNKKAEQGERLFKILPDVFVFGYAGCEGDLIKLSFRPNPNFRPPSIEARVFQNMEGEMTVDSKQERLAAINGHLMEDVKFGGGLLGHLDKGGKFEVRQTEVAPGQWEMTVLVVDMKGKVLLFKTIDVQQVESHLDFHRVPDDLTLAQAADILNKQIVMASNRYAR
ncbi:MAG: hypothetical protein ABR881_26675 [Candidatus Sulfotelmatobacter sp.]